MNSKNHSRTFNTFLSHTSDVTATHVTAHLGYPRSNSKLAAQSIVQQSHNKMPPIALIFTLFLSLTTADVKVYDITAENATHLTNGSFYQPSVVKARNRLVYVSFPRTNNDTTIKLEWDEVRSCEITLARVGYLSTSVRSLGDGKIVVGLVEDELGAEASSVGVTFYVVDFKNNCGYKRFEVQFGGTILYSFEPFNIVPYYDSFDVFAKSQLHCKPRGSLCLIRYSETGIHLGTRNFDFDTTDANFDLESIHPLTEFEPSSGYFYLSKQTTVIRILDSSLKTLRQHKTLGYPIAHSVLNGDIGLCIDTYDADSSVECVKIDARMKIKNRVRLTDANYFGTRRLYNLLDGSSLLISLSRGQISGLVKRLGVDGRLGEAATLFRYECESLYSEPRDYFAELKGGVYCFSYACSDGLVTHCTGLEERATPAYLT